MPTVTDRAEADWAEADWAQAEFDQGQPTRPDPAGSCGASTENDLTGVPAARQNDVRDHR
jgi:hypothetical protein